MQEFFDKFRAGPRPHKVIRKRPNPAKNATSKKGQDCGHARTEKTQSTNCDFEGRRCSFGKCLFVGCIFHRVGAALSDFA